MKYRLTAAEMETSITFCRGDENASVFTADRRQMARFDRLCEHFPAAYRCVWTDPLVLGDGLPAGKKYSVPVRLVRFAKPASEAQRAAARENMTKIVSSIASARGNAR